jgi:hypothetical protein
MRVFISWSGDDSRRAAELIHTWLKNVIQEVEPWISARDIPKGGKWQSSLGTSLSDTSFGIIMVTKSNVNAPWVLFEAGALSNVPNSSVVPMLCGISELALANTPLSQFQAVPVNKIGMLSLVVGINKQCLKPLEDKQINDTFEKWWPDFERGYKNIPFLSNSDEEQSGRLPQVPFGNALEDIMQSLRRIEQTINSPTAYGDKSQGIFGTTLNTFGGLSGLGIGPLAASGLTADDVSRVSAAIDLDRAIKVATLSAHANDAKRVISGYSDPGRKVASKKPDGGKKGD